MPKAFAVLLAACALVHVASAADRKLLQSDYLGYRTRFNVEAPQASRFSAGFATSASGPATFSETTKFTSLTPPSAAFGVNPTGGFAEYKDTTRIDATLPRYSGVFRASRANTWAADLSAGTRLTPDIQYSTKIRPTIPLTFPVFSAGGTLLPTPNYQAVINPPRGVLGAPTPAAPAKKGAAPGGKEAGGGEGAAGGEGGDRRRHLLNWGADRSFVGQAPATPQVDYYRRPPPAESSSGLNVRADRVYVDGGAKIPGNLVTSSSSTKAVFAPQRSFPVGGKGDWTVVNLSRGPSTITQVNNAAINWGSGGAVVSNGVPLAITSTDGVVAPSPAKYTGLSWTPQIGDRPNGFIEAKSRTQVPLPGVGK